MTRLNRQDWADLIKSAEMQCKQAEISMLQYENLLTIGKEQMGRMAKEETKEVEEEVKELVEDIKEEDGEPKTSTD